MGFTVGSGNGASEGEGAGAAVSRENGSDELLVTGVDVEAVDGSGAGLDDGVKDGGSEYVGSADGLARGEAIGGSV